MDTPDRCEPIQEQIARGEPLDPHARAHVVACASCAALAADALALEALMQDGLDAGGAVPAGFTDRVMARIEADTAPEPEGEWRLGRLLGRRWVQLALAQLGLAVAAANLIRVVFSALVPTLSLGGAP